MAAKLTISLLHTGITFCTWVCVRLALRTHSAVGNVGSGDWRATWAWCEWGIQGSSGFTITLNNLVLPPNILPLLSIFLRRSSLSTRCVIIDAPTLPTTAFPEDCTRTLPRPFHGRWRRAFPSDWICLEEVIDVSMDVCDIILACCFTLGLHCLDECVLDLLWQGAHTALSETLGLETGVLPANELNEAPITETSSRSRWAISYFRRISS